MGSGRRRGGGGVGVHACRPVETAARSLAIPSPARAASNGKSGQVEARTRSHACVGERRQMGTVDARGGMMRVRQVDEGVGDRSRRG